MVGVSYRTCPTELRAQLSVLKTDAPAFLAQLLEAGCDEAVVLSTCNRTEIYFVGGDAEAVVRTLAARAKRPVSELRPYLYEKACVCAACHLFRVTAGLDSAVLGESEIVAQVKEAWRLASEAGTCHQRMDMVFQRALEASKRVRTETSLCRSMTSTATLAIQEAQSFWGGLEGRSVLLVGAGKIAVRLTKDLKPLGVRLTVLSRTLASADGLAQEVGARSGTMDSLDEAMQEADVVFLAASVTEPVLDHSSVERAMRVRGGRPLVAVDLGLPPNAAPGIDVPGFRCTPLDTLQSASAANSEQRLAQVPAALEILVEELAAFGRALAERAAAPTIRALLHRGESVRRHNVEWAAEKLGSLTNKEMKVIDEMARRMVIGLLQEPIDSLKDEFSEGEHRKLVEKLFRLGEEAASA